MTTESAQAVQNDSAKIWAELDAQDAGNAVSPPAGTVIEQQPAAQPGTKTEAKPEGSEAAAPAQAADAAAAAVPPEQQVLLDKINGLESQLTGALKRVRNVEGRFGELNAQQQAARDAAASGAATPSAKEIRDAQGSPEKMATLKRDYPEFGAAIEAALDERTSGLQRQLTDLSALVAKQPAGTVTTADVENLRNELTVEHVHAGWKETVKLPEFAGWKNRQSREVQMLAASDSPQDAIRLLDLYAESRKPKPNNNQRLESAAAIPAGRSSSSQHGAKPVEDMNKAEFWGYLDQQDAQKSKQG